MPWYVTPEYSSYREARMFFRHEVPNEYNAAWDLLRKHDDPEGQVALFQSYPTGKQETFTFAELDRMSNQVAHGLREFGIEFGDRVAVIVPQKPANPLTHLACWKLGAISLPISILYGTEALRYRFDHADVSVAVVDFDVVERVESIRDDCPDLEHVIVVDGDEQRGETTFDALRRDRKRTLRLAETEGSTPAVIAYTSGTTGDPKGVVHTHDVWVGHAQGFHAGFEHRVRDNGIFWTPSEWSWFGSMVMMYPAWHYGRPVVGHPMDRFDAETSFEILEAFNVTGSFLAPTAIRMLMAVDAPAERYDLSLEVITTGGELVTEELFEWASEALDGVALNEGYGRTEGTMLTRNCRAWYDVRPGSMGRPAPGRTLELIDPDTCEPVATGEVGEIAVLRGDGPGLFEEYWRDPEATAAARMTNDRGQVWDLTGDLARRDEDGYFWFRARKDEMIITSGYRVDPSEIEAAIRTVDAVEEVGVRGVPDDERGEIIKAFVVPDSQATAGDQLRQTVQETVREQVGQHLYPREVAFVDALPRTVTGKVKRTDLTE